MAKYQKKPVETDAVPDPHDAFIAEEWRKLEERVAEARQNVQDTERSIRKGARRTSHRFSL
ncbi:hypothetical protein E1297_10465 [Roseibium sp. RKSG952]|nr:hypothetical protein [Roseibium sp. RKSG952]